MIKVNLKSGKTLSYDLVNDSERQKWETDCSEVSFQSQITAIAIFHNSQWFTLPLPKRYRQFHFEANLVDSKDGYKGEQIKCYADDVLISITVYWGERPRMSRTDVVKVGRRRFNPVLKAR